MIGYIEGTLLKREDERILLLAGQVGYEILLPGIVMESLKTKEIGDKISLYIYWHQTQSQPKPVLIGFNLEIEKAFFQRFISVGDIGPMKAVKALGISSHEIASAIESKDVGRLSQLKGIGARTAQKIIAALSGKMETFILKGSEESGATPVFSDVENQVLDVLVKQLGHHPAEAKKMVADALKRNPSISTPEGLFDEIYKGREAAS
jgi:holliday junction DNA helicase RuvA